MGREPRTAARPAPQSATERRHDRQVLGALERIADALEARPRVVVLVVDGPLTVGQQRELAAQIAAAVDGVAGTSSSTAPDEPAAGP